VGAPPADRHPTEVVHRSSDRRPSAGVEVVAPAEPGPTDSARIVGRHQSETVGPALDGARIVVSGGRGLASAGAYASSNGSRRCSMGHPPRRVRSSMPAGYRTRTRSDRRQDRDARVYIACGISGATQHLVGMKGRSTFIAVNKDENAPIFALCDLAVVGDVLQVLPKLISALEARR